MRTSGYKFFEITIKGGLNWQEWERRVPPRVALTEFLNKPREYRIIAVGSFLDKYPKKKINLRS
jgi:hypothetical protein